MLNLKSSVDHYRTFVIRCIADQSTATSVAYDVPIGDDFAVIFRFQEILEHLE